VARACPSCGADNAVAARFCATCGSELPGGCPRCGAEVPPDARFCPSCGLPLVADEVPDERKLVTAVFVDLVDSTALGDRLDPERGRAILQAYFSIVSSTAAAWGGSIEKFIGDAAVAIFGVPRVREDDAARAVSAAVEIRDRVAELAAELAERNGLQLAIRIGVNTGDVVAPADVRLDRAMVTGDAINVAARLETAAGTGEILVGERTFQATRSVFRYASAERVMVKGKAEALVVHRLEGRIRGAFEAGPARNLQARIVGRERELAVLGGLLDEAIETRSPRLGLVYGPAGIGKSRLVQEAIALGSSERPDLTTLRGRCPAVDKGIAYWPLAEIVRSACGISLDDPVELARAKLDERARPLLTSAGYAEDDVAATIFALATTAGIPLPDNPLERARPLAVKTELGRRWPAFASALASRGPIVFVVEDLHWASPLLISMIEQVLARSTGAVLIVATARPEFAETQPSFAVGRSDVATLSLRPLDRRQAAGLLDGLLPDRSLPTKIEDDILMTAEGNPLFIEEIVTRLVEMGSIVREDGRWRSTDGETSLAIPDSIHGLLAARIDGLPDAERRVIREAAVVGKVFWDQPVATAVGAADIGDPLSELERRGLVALRPRSSLAGQVEYAFKHALIRDVAYAGLSIARRATAHAAAADWLGTLSPERPEELAELIAYHYEHALGDGADLAWPAGSTELQDLRQRAMKAFRIAGVTARKRYDLARATELHERAVELAVTPLERAVALEELGDVHDAAYDGDHAKLAWDESIAIWRTLPDGGTAIARQCMKTARMAAIMWGSFGTPMDPERIDECVRTGFDAGPDPETRAWLELLEAAAGVRWIAFHRPDPIPAVERTRAADAARAYVERTGNTILEAMELRVRCALLIANGDVDGAIAATRRQLAVADVLDDPRERHLGLIEAANTLTWVAGEAEAMIEPLYRALRIGRELRPHDVNHSTMTLSAALYLAGRWDEIPALVDEHRSAFAAQRDSSCPFAMAGFPLAAVVLAQRGEPDQARTVAREMPESEWPVGMVEAFQAMATLALGDASGARDQARRVLDAGARNYSEEPAIELLVMADALIALGEWDGLATFLPELRARQRLVALGGPTADRAEGLVLANAGSTAAAIEHLERAIVAFDGLAVFEAARTREHLAELDPSRRHELLDAALATYVALGATPHASRVRSLVD